MNQTYTIVDTQMDNLEYFNHDGFKLAYRHNTKTRDEPILLIHGFASSSFINWVSTGWFELLSKANYHVIAIDNRGHGYSDKSHSETDYTPEKMANDALALLDHLNIPKAHIMGYSMGARISAYLALKNSNIVRSLIFGGMGRAMIDDHGDWQTVYNALLAENPETINNKRGQMFRKFADNSYSDRKALAACIKASKKELKENEVRTINLPSLVAVGSKDDIAGEPDYLANILPQGEAFTIPDRDHMLAVGDKIYKQKVLDFLKLHNFQCEYSVLSSL